MKIKVNREEGLFHFVGEEKDTKQIHMDASEEIGGTDKGIRPMQMLLYGIAGCSGIDMVSILKKQKQNLVDISIEVNAEREKEAVPSLFTDIQVHFILKGDLDAVKVQKALDLTFTKYCSVALTIGKTAEIGYSFEIISQ